MFFARLRILLDTLNPIKSTGVARVCDGRSDYGSHVVHSGLSSIYRAEEA